MFMGIALSDIGFADYGEIHKMFLFTDLRMLFTLVGFGGVNPAIAAT